MFFLYLYYNKKGVDSLTFMVMSEREIKGYSCFREIGNSNDG